MCYAVGMRPNISYLHKQGRLRCLDELMLIYEHNYQQLATLTPDLDVLSDYEVSTAPKAMDLHMRILDRAAYTTTLVLSYHFGLDTGIVAEPDLTIRTYHDARLTEVMSGGERQRHRGRRSVIRGLPAELEEKWRINRFLERWLGYCLHQGHGFGAATARYRRSDKTDPLIV